MAVASALCDLAAHIVTVVKYEMRYYVGCVKHINLDTPSSVPLFVFYTCFLLWYVYIYEDISHFLLYSVLFKHSCRLLLKKLLFYD